MTGFVPNSREIERWLVDSLSQRLGIDRAEIAVEEQFEAYGLGSVDAAGLVGELEAWLGTKLPVTLAWEYPTIRRLARHLAGALPDPGPAPTPAPVMLDHEPLAVVGIGCRFPGATSPESLWNLVKDGKSAVSEVPASRFNAATAVDPDPAVSRMLNIRWGGFVDPVGDFDTAFFGISPREAERMDPQQRLLLEVAWEAIEDSGTTPAALKAARAGVFVGISTSDFGRLELADLRRIDAYSGTGSALSIAANRLSHVLDLPGPSLAVDTACSSSLVALHLACRSIRAGECDAALVAGVNLILSPAVTINFAKAGAMASDGRCKAFDDRADGYVRGEGAGLVVLKPLTRAQSDGDRIYALVLGTAINHDGRTNGLMAPNPASQRELLKRAYADAGVDPRAVDYVEAHGSGTLIGDPIEAEALGAVVGAGRPAGEPCLIGSIKTNIGHSEAAAGVAGLIKTAMALHRGEIPPSLNFETPNRFIDFEGLGLRVARQLEQWPRRSQPPLAGVSSFGFGGANAHAVMSAAPGAEQLVKEPDSVTAALLPISARDHLALAALVEEYAATLVDGPLRNVSLRAVSAAAALRRPHHRYRRAFIATERDALISDLQRAVVRPRERNGGSPPRVIMLCPGQGTQYAGMGDGLQCEPVFRMALARCDAAIRRAGGPRLLLAEDHGANGVDQGLVEVTQLALFALQVSLGELWRSWGIEPAAVIGHSMGEVAAAYLAGALSLADAATVICRRSEAMASIDQEGAMAAIELPVSDLEPLLARHLGRVTVAALNGPRSTVISGDASSVIQVVDDTMRNGALATLIPVSVASHSHHMQLAKDRLATDLNGLAPQTLMLPMVSTVTGRSLEGHELDADYWARGLIEPVRFAEGLQQAAGKGIDVVLELSPHPTLVTPTAETLREAGVDAVVLPSLRRNVADHEALLQALGTLYECGAEPRWSAVQSAPAQPLVLPRYPWQRDPVPLKPASAGSETQETGGDHPLLRRRPAGVQHRWQTDIRAGDHSWIDDHRVDGASTIPGAALAEAVLAAAGELETGERHEIRDLEFLAPIIVPATGAVHIETVFTADTDRWQFDVYSARDRDYSDGVGPTRCVLHATGLVGRACEPPSDIVPLKTLAARCQRDLTMTEFHDRLERSGLNYGPNCRAITQLRLGAGEALALLEPAPGMRRMGGSLVHPALLDAGLQVLAGALWDLLDISCLALPVSLERAVIWQPIVGRVWVHAQTARHGRSNTSAVGTITMFDDVGTVLGRIKQVRIARVSRSSSASADPTRWIFSQTWIPASRPLADTRASGRGGVWIILAGRSGLASAVAERLQQEGHGVRVVKDLPESRQDMSTFVEAASRGSHLAGMLHLLSLDTATGDAMAIAQKNCAGALMLYQSWFDQGAASGVPLVLVTRQAHCVQTDEAPTGIGPASLWGFGRTIAREEPSLDVRCIDLGEPLPGDIDVLVDEILLKYCEGEVALRSPDRRFVPQLKPIRLPAASVQRPTGPVQFTIERPNDLRSGRLRRVRRPEPAPGHVAIDVVAAGLNYRDVLTALGVFPWTLDGPPALGIECAGKVSAVGAGVRDLRIGDAVTGFALPSLATIATAPATLMVRMPNNVTFRESASSILGYAMAHYALRHLATLRSGERVLMHSGTDGVGLAAVAIAKSVGATVYATARLEANRRLLMKWGAAAAMDSHSLDFADEILDLTQGAGVDVVLNHLIGDVRQPSLSVLAPFGRFVDFGERDIRLSAKLSLGALANNISLFTVDLYGLIAAKPEFVGALLRSILERLDRGDLEPLPFEAHRIEETGSALKQMAEDSNLGKIIIDVASGPVASDRSSPRASSVLITGGLGALGLRVAEALVEDGARHLVLTGRNAPSPIARQRVDALRAQGASVTTVRADVALRNELDMMLRNLRASGPPLTTVIHAAGVLDDAILPRLDQQQLRRVLLPKVAGAWNLHELTRDDPIEAFVLFSSAAGVLGSPAQAPYAAGNAALDALANLRVAAGLPALSIAWGPWSLIGAAVRATGLDRLARHGIGTILPDRGIEVFRRVLRLQGCLAVIPFIDGVRPPVPCGRSRGRTGTVGPAGHLSGTEPEREEGLSSRFRVEVAAVLRIDADRLDTTVPLNRLGLDSLMAIEVRNRITEATGITLSLTELLSGPSIDDFTDRLSDAELPEPKQWTFLQAASNALSAERVEHGSPEQVLENLDALSDEQVTRFLERLADGEGQP